MTKTYSLSEHLIDMIKETAKQQGTTQSKLIETAMTIYLLINKSTPKQAKQLTELIPKNQIDLFELLKK